MPTPSNAELESALKKVRKAYLWLFLAPLIVLVLTFIGYAILAFYTASTGNHNVAAILSVVLAIIAVVAVSLTVIFGIFALAGYFSLKNGVLKLLQKEDYSNLSIEQLIYLCKSSVAAFFVTFVFTLGNRLYYWAIIPVISCVLGFIVAFFPNPILSAFVSLVGLGSFVIAVIMAGFGRRRAWEKYAPKDFDKFKKKQKIIGIVALIVFIIFFGIGLVRAYQIFSVTGKYLQGSVSQDEMTFQIAKAQYPSLVYADYKNGGDIANKDFENLSDINNFTVSSELFKNVENQSYMIGYLMDFYINCSKNFHLDKYQCQKVFTDKVVKLLPAANNAIK